MKPHTETKKRDEYAKHIHAVKAKAERVQVLRALLLTHEVSNGRFDRDYMKGLRHRIRAAEIQFTAMGGER